MKIEGKVAVVTGAASGIGQATALDLAKRRVKALALVDRSERVLEVAQAINGVVGRTVAQGFTGDAADGSFRAEVFDRISRNDGVVNIENLSSKARVVIEGKEPVAPGETKMFVLPVVFRIGNTRIEALKRRSKLWKWSA